jgi:hypothetical protein
MSGVSGARGFFGFADFGEVDFAGFVFADGCDICVYLDD